MNHQRRLYPIEESCRLLCLSRAKVYELINTQQLASVKICGRRLIPAESIDSLVATALVDAQASQQAA